MQWYAMDRYVTAVQRTGSRKKTRLDDETAKNQKRRCDDGDDDDSEDNDGGAADEPAARLDRSRSEDSGVAELEKSKDWIHMTQREVRGLSDLVTFLETDEEAKHHVPTGVRSADELLSRAKVINHLLLMTIS